jgi:hypothetical protein
MFVAYAGEDGATLVHRRLFLTELVAEGSLPACWVTCDEGYGRSTSWTLGLGYIAEVSVDTRLWPERPPAVVPRDRSALDIGPFASSRSTLAGSDSGCDSSRDSGCGDVPCAAAVAVVLVSGPSLSEEKSADSANTNSSRNPSGSTSHFGRAVPADWQVSTMLLIPRPHASIMPARKNAFAIPGLSG